jgi:hypothetical protein
MRIEELEAQFHQIDKLSLSHSITVELENTTSILKVSRENPIIEEQEVEFPVPYREPTRAESRPEYERLVEIDLSEADIPDEFIDERIKLSINKTKVGELHGVKIMGIGASGVYEVVEDYSYDVSYHSLRRKMPLETRQHYHSLVGLTLEQRIQRSQHICTITVPQGFQYDRASVPRIFWVIISKDDLSNVPPLFHDFLYRYGGVLPKNHVKPYDQFTRPEADSLFEHLMGQSGVRGWRKALAFQAVCYFSSFAWNKSAAI